MATKRPSALEAMKLAAKGGDKPKPGKTTVAKSAAKAQRGETMTTAIHIRRDHWDLLRRAAFARAEATGGRASVSAIIGELVERNRDKLARGEV